MAEKPQTRKQERSQDDRRAKRRIGEQLIEEGIISATQLQQVLKRQSQVGGHLGSLLIEMGFVAIEDLLEYLSSKFNVPAVNLFEKKVEPDVVCLIPLAKLTKYNILPLSDDGQVVTLAMTNPQDFSAINEVEFLLGRKVKPVVVPAFMMQVALDHLQSDPTCRIEGEALAELVAMEKGADSPKLVSLLRYLIKSKANDMLICAGVPPSLKMGNKLKRLALPALSPEDCERYAHELMPRKGWEIFRRRNDYGFSAVYKGIGRFRITAYRQRGSVSIAIRPILDNVPSLRQLNLPAWLADFALRPTGLILVCGPAGHGKSTTLAAMVDIINSRRGCNIITLEDPVEYLHKHKMSNICQREIGTDAPTFIDGLRNIFRQAPDVIVIGEMRDRETFRIALQAAGSGHLVLSTAHADSATAVIERIINMFEPHEQALIRSMLSECLLLSLSQRLVPKKKEPGRILALEKLINSHRLRKFIREGKTHQIRSQLQTGSEDFTSIDIELANLCRQGRIDFEDGLMFAGDKTFYRELVEAGPG